MSGTYNHLPISDINISQLASSYNILVIGQVEDDASIEYGCEREIDNYELVRMAIIENPDAEVYFKPHPDVIAGNRKGKSSIESIEMLAIIIGNISIHSAIMDMDHIYTITSGAGFEALLHGKKVTTIGCPFYAGWGLTDDRQENIRRDKNLTIEELFLCAYMLYPRYVSLANKGSISTSSAIDELNVLSIRNKKMGDIKTEY